MNVNTFLIAFLGLTLTPNLPEYDPVSWFFFFMTIVAGSWVVVSLLWFAYKRLKR